MRFSEVTLKYVQRVIMVAISNLATVRMLIKACYYPLKLVNQFLSTFAASIAIMSWTIFGPYHELMQV